MSRKGTINRRTGKTTPRNKAKTHWGKKSPARRAAPAKAGKARTSKAAKS